MAILKNTTAWPAWGFHVAIFWPLGSSLLLCNPSVRCNSLWSHRLQHTRLLCPSLSPGVCSNSRKSSRWCCLTVSSFAAPLYFGLQSFPASGSFPFFFFLLHKYFATLLLLKILKQFLPILMLTISIISHETKSNLDFKEFQGLKCPSGSSLDVQWLRLQA